MWQTFQGINTNVLQEETNLFKTLFIILPETQLLFSLTLVITSSKIKYIIQINNPNNIIRKINPQFSFIFIYRFYQKSFLHSRETRSLEKFHFNKNISPVGMSWIKLNLLLELPHHNLYIIQTTSCPTSHKINPEEFPSILITHWDSILLELLASCLQSSNLCSMFLGHISLIDRHSVPMEYFLNIIEFLTSVFRRVLILNWLLELNILLYKLEDIAKHADLYFLFLYVPVIFLIALSTRWTLLYFR